MHYLWSPASLGFDELYLQAGICPKSVQKRERGDHKLQKLEPLSLVSMLSSMLGILVFYFIVFIDRILTKL